MKLYCMCQANGGEARGKQDKQVFLAPNRFGDYDSETDMRTVALQKSMEVVKNGVKQVIAKRSIANDWSGKPLGKTKQHYPYVDMYRCKHCHSIIIVEG